MALGLENLVTNGWHVLEGCSDTFRSSIAYILADLKESELKDLSGNGVSLPCFVAFVL